MGIRGRCDEELQVQSGLWLIIAGEERRTLVEKFVRDSSKWLESFQTTRINRGNKFSLAIE